MAIGAAPALAEEEPAQFSPEGQDITQGISWSGSLTLENEGSATDCTTGLNYGFASGGQFVVSYYTGLKLYLWCEGGGKLEWLPIGYPAYDSGYKLGFEDLFSVSHESPFGDFGGNWWLDPVWVEVPFVNGSESEPSTIVFDDTVIGHLDADESPITATGTLEVTTNSGGLLTLTK